MSGHRVDPWAVGPCNGQARATISNPTLGFGSGMGHKKKYQIFSGPTRLGLFFIPQKVVVFEHTLNTHHTQPTHLTHISTLRCTLDLKLNTETHIQYIHEDQISLSDKNIASYCAAYAPEDTTAENQNKSPGAHQATKHGFERWRAGSTPASLAN